MLIFRLQCVNASHLNYFKIMTTTQRSQGVTVKPYTQHSVALLYEQEDSVDATTLTFRSVSHVCLPHPRNWVTVTCPRQGRGTAVSVGNVACYKWRQGSNHPPELSPRLTLVWSGQERPAARGWWEPCSPSLQTRNLALPASFKQVQATVTSSQLFLRWKWGDLIIDEDDDSPITTAHECCIDGHPSPLLPVWAVPQSTFSGLLKSDCKHKQAN